jgi:hypothetical protein
MTDSRCQQNRACNFSRKLENSVRAYIAAAERFVDEPNYTTARIRYEFVTFGVDSAIEDIGLTGLSKSTGLAKKLGLALADAQRFFHRIQH